MSISLSRQSTKNSVLLSKRPIEKNYKVFAVNFHGKSLEPIRNEFIKMGLDGARRRVILVDIESERRRASEQRASIKTTRVTIKPPIKRKSRATDSEKGSVDYPPEGYLNTARESIARENTFNVDVNVAIMAIQRLRHDYDEAGVLLAKEREFNLFDYWNANLEKPSTKRKPSLISSKSIDKDLLKKKRLTAIREDEEMPNITCLKLASRAHNKVGQPVSLLKKKYIEDDPEDSKLFIVLIGMFDENFYLELIQRGEPLQAIINFLPGEVPYDRLLPSFEHQVFVANTLEQLHAQIYEMRKKADTKPTGIFQTYLPKISDCAAVKYAQKIYDQLTWYFYDIEILQRNYTEFYFLPFRMTDVAMPRSYSLTETLDVISNLRLQGNYLQNPFPAVNANITTVILYVDMLFNAVERSADILTEWETILISTTLPKRIYTMYNDLVDKLTQQYADSFYSITKIKKVERLFVEETNSTLVQMVQYVDHELFRHIYLACLEYKIQRKYINNSYHRQDLPYEQYENAEIEDFDLPHYAKLYPTTDGVAQRLLILLDDYDNFEVTEIYPRNKLYEFRRRLYEVVEQNRMFTIPTRLCFREFTLFCYEEFLANLISEEMSESLASQNLTDVERFEKLLRRLAQDYNPDIFIRPNSLKARRAIMVSAMLGLRSSQRDSARERELQMASDALMNLSIRKNSAGLPKTHPMLFGYNLEDIRQEIWVKDSKYYFDEGYVKLYEEKWNFSDTNKNLNLKINNNTLTLGTPQDTVFKILPYMRVVTKNDVNIRLQADPEECAKIVINYPNGLSVYYEQKRTQQIWSREETPANEKRRIITQHGAVIVKYHNDEMILIMRYNGEVYRLYKNEIVFSESGDGEAEEMFSRTGETGTTSSPERNTLSSTPSKLFSTLIENEKSNRSDYSRVPPEARPIKLNRSKKSQSRSSSRKQDSHSAGGDASTFSLGSSVSLGSYISEHEPDENLIADELKFLNKLISEYNLKYKHLIVTTAMGKVYNLTHLGQFYESAQVGNEEWHDYFLDECYAMRGDGVRMIWGMDFFRCYHADGTLFHTNTEEILHTFHFPDEYSDNISISSSHGNYDEEIIGDGAHSQKSTASKGHTSTKSSSLEKRTTTSTKSPSYKTTSTKEPSSKETTTKETSTTKDTSTQETSTQETSTKETTTKTTSTKTTSTKTTSTKTTSTKTPSAKTPSFKTQSSKTTSSKTPSLETPSTTTPGSKTTTSSKGKQGHGYERFLQTLEEIEEDSMPKMHPGYVCAHIGIQEICHRNYASVYFLPQFMNYEEVHYLMEVKGADDIIIQKAREPVPSDETSATLSESWRDQADEELLETDTSKSTTETISYPVDMPTNTTTDDKQSYAYPPFKDRLTNASFVQSRSMHVTSPQQSTDTALSPTLSRQSPENKTESDPDIEEEEIPLRDVLKVWIGNDFYLVVSEHDLELQAMISHNDYRYGGEKLRDTIKFKISYIENLRDVFQTLVDRISAFKKPFKSRMETLYFLEKTLDDCNLKGLEFMTELPDMGIYHFEKGNTITQFSKLDTIFEKFAKKCDWHDEDMAKFPRFRPKPEKRKTPLDNFPMVLSVNIFLKIPTLLRGTYEINKLMDPLERVNFKKARYQIRETMSYYVYPHLDVEIKKRTSQLNWRQQHEEKLRQKLVEAQRKGLYHAILRHKTYPKYFMFQEKFNGRAECIDYFEFCLERCQEKNKTKNKWATRQQQQHLQKNQRDNQKSYGDTSTATSRNITTKRNYY